MSSGVFTPIEIALVQKVFDQVASKAWFTRSDERRQEFALHVIDAYRRGVENEDELVQHCTELARQSFGNGGLA